MNNLENKNLEELRTLIDTIDNKILNAIKERFEVINAVSIYKKKNNIDAYQPGRWEKVLNDKIKKAEELGLDKEMIENIWNSMHKAALKAENDIIKQ